MTQEMINSLYIAWTQGGDDEIYRDRAECLAWLKAGQEDGEPILAEVDDLEEVAERLCDMYEREAEEE